MKKRTIFKLYSIAGVAFLLGLVKYVFYETGIPSKFLLIELLSFVAFIGLLYFSDKHVRKAIEEQKEFRSNIKEIKKSCATEIEELKNIIEEINKEKSKQMHTLNEVDIISKKISQSVSGISELDKYGAKLLQEIAEYYELGLGLCYFMTQPSSNFNVIATYAVDKNDVVESFETGEGLSGQVAVDQKPMVLNEIDEDYITIESGSGSSKPKYIYLLPIVKNNKTVGLIELATFKPIGIDIHWASINDIIAQSISL
jgi:hypothetical protein